jgi:tRNA(Arg) A34 adenosine deaminase TadA
MRQPEPALPLVASRRTFLQSASLAATASMFPGGRFALAGPHPAANMASPVEPALDAKRMRELAAWTGLTMQTPNPVPYGAEIFHSKTGESLVRATNAVRKENDPSAHGEIHAIRLACGKLGSYSLTGYTLYTTCEPCPMCMACALWAGLDRVVYGATIADAARYGHQIMIPAAEVVKRSDMPCVVDGPVERDLCLTLFTNPNMQKAFKEWNFPKH